LENYKFLNIVHDFGESIHILTFYSFFNMKEKRYY